jgi:hypothetical protein
MSKNSALRALRFGSAFDLANLWTDQALGSPNDGVGLNAHNTD